MADVITRFKLETTQYDSKLRDASQALSQYARQASLAGNEFDKFTKDQAESARSLGSISTSANNAKDKVRELVAAYNQAANAYNALTKEQQQSDWGRALAESVQELKGRITEAKQELYSMGDAIKDVKKNSSGLFGEGGLTGMLAVTGGNLLARGIENLASGLMESVQQSIQLAREGEGVRLAFERLNQPGLLDNLKEATHGTVSEIELMKQAVKFEQFKLPLEDLTTYLAFAQQKAKDTGESVDYMVNSITTGLGRQSKQILDNLGISAAELTRRMNEGADMTKAVADIIREEMSKAGDYIETAADRAARAAADASNEMEAFGRNAAPIAEEWGKTWNALSLGAMDFANTLLGPVAESIRSTQNILNETKEDRIIKMFEAFDKIAKEQQEEANKKKPKWGDTPVVTAPGGYVEVTDAHTGKVIGGRHFDDLDDENAIKKWRKSLHKTPKTPKTTTKTKTDTFVDELTPGSIADYTKQIQELRKLQNDVSTKEGWQGLQDEIDHLNVLIKELKGELKVEPYNFGSDASKRSDNYWSELEKKFSNPDKIIGSGLEKIVKEINKSQEKKEVNLTKEIGNMAGGFSSMVSGIESLGIKVPEGLKDVVNGIQGVMSILSGITTIITAIEAIAAADTIIPFARGGVVRAASGFMVPGNNYSGDLVPAYLNSGEMVLNKFQQQALAGTLENGGMKNISISGALRGEDIVLVADRYGRRTGKGELAFWR